MKAVIRVYIEYTKYYSIDIDLGFCLLPKYKIKQNIHNNINTIIKRLPYRFYHRVQNGYKFYIVNIYFKD